MDVLYCWCEKRDLVCLRADLSAALDRPPDGQFTTAPLQVLSNQNRRKTALLRRLFGFGRDDRTWSRRDLRGSVFRGS